MSRLWKTLQVAAKAKEADDIASFEFIDPAGEPLPKFSAGAHIDIEIVPGLVRQYSLCNDPREQHRYLIGVLREPASRGGSATLVDTVVPGALVPTSEPRNHFALDPSATRVVLMAGGIGICRSCAWQSIWPPRRPHSSCITAQEVVRGRRFGTGSADRRSRIGRASISTTHRDPCSSI
jgi:hypothetical protein